MKRIGEILAVLHREKNWPVVEKGGGRWEITVHFVDGRSQVVHAQARRDNENDEVVALWSVLGKRASVKDHTRLLEANAGFCYAACAYDGDDVVLRHCHLVHDADVTELAKTINYIGFETARLAEELSD